MMLRIWNTILYFLFCGYNCNTNQKPFTSYQRKMSSNCRFNVVESVRNVVANSLEKLSNLTNNGPMSTNVTIKQGKLVGSTLKSRNGREFFAFQGIPYAQPPIGELRFKNPVPAKRWSSVYQATSEPKRCPQKNVIDHKITNEIIGEEDCLYLNVYTPKTLNKKGNLMPVMFWIPGRGFSSGHGGLSINGPHYLMDKDVVVVSINYRVGILGFLSTEDDILPGNYGLKDQVLALQWVRDNIKKFNGDPTKVTIFGESAGAASVGLHLLSPMSKKLFHKAIMESGSPLSQWAVSQPIMAKKRAEELYKKLECDPTKLVDCLRSVSVEKLVDFEHNYFESAFPSVYFQPVVENCENSSQSFLCKNPLEDFKLESNVPVLLGMGSGEGRYFASSMYDRKGRFISELDELFNFAIASSVDNYYILDPSDVKTIGEKIRERYFPRGNMDQLSQAAKMVNDSFFIRGINDMAMKMAPNVHYYVYDYSSEPISNCYFGEYPRKVDAIHSDETISLFFIDGVPELIGTDLEFSNLLVNIWTQFATTDELTTNGKPDGVKWPKFDTKDMKYVSIETFRTVIMEKPYMNDYDFWNKLKEGLIKFND